MLDHQDRTISREELEKRAYQLYLQRGAEHGHDEEDWVLAQAQLTEERNRGHEASESFKTQSAGRYRRTSLRTIFGFRTIAHRPKINQCTSLGPTLAVRND